MPWGTPLSLLPVELRPVNQRASTNGGGFYGQTQARQLPTYNCATMENLDLFDQLTQRVERLLQQPGEVIERDTLVAYAWADRVVGPGSLNQQVYTLRKILGDEKNLQIIQTVLQQHHKGEESPCNSHGASSSRWPPGA